MDARESLQKLTDCLGEETKILSALVNNGEFLVDPPTCCAPKETVRPGLANAALLNRDNKSGHALPSLQLTNTSTSVGQGRLLREQTLLHLNQTLSHARNMVQLALSSGTLQRLSQTERLRSAAPAAVQSSSFLPAAKKKKQNVNKTARPSQFVLMHFGEEDADKVIADESIPLRGLVELLFNEK